MLHLAKRVAKKMSRQLVFQKGEELCLTASTPAFGEVVRPFWFVQKVGTIT